MQRSGALRQPKGGHQPHAAVRGAASAQRTSIAGSGQGCCVSPRDINRMQRSGTLRQPKGGHQPHAAVRGAFVSRGHAGGEGLVWGGALRACMQRSGVLRQPKGGHQPQAAVRGAASAQGTSTACSGQGRCVSPKEDINRMQRSGALRQPKGGHQPHAAVGSAASAQKDRQGGAGICLMKDPVRTHAAVRGAPSAHRTSAAGSGQGRLARDIKGAPTHSLIGICYKGAAVQQRCTPAAGGSAATRLEDATDRSSGRARHTHQDPLTLLGIPAEAGF
jgi:hypothetical protein